jgi:hypothetical protein
MSKIKEFILYPLIVGLIVAFFTYILPMLTEKRKKIEYDIEQPISYLQPDKIGSLDIKINGYDTKELNSYTVNLKNTGDIPVKDLEVLFGFSQLESGFKILTEFHKTKPAYQFGKIQKLECDSLSEKYNYGLFNPGDEATITILTSRNASLNVYAKQEELLFIKMNKNSWHDKWEPWIQIASILIAVSGSLLTKILESSNSLKTLIRKLFA